MIFKGLKIRLYPTIFQQSLFEFNFGANRFVWNITLDMLIKRHESNRKLTFPTSYDLNYLLVPLKNEYPWLKESESTSLQSTMSNLVKAYQSFFNKKHRFPKFKSKKYYKQSYQSKVSNNLRITKKYIFIPKVGMVKYKSGRKIPSKLVSITIRKSSSGKFYAILLSREKIIDFNKTNMNVGLDMGIKNLLTLSNGKKIPAMTFDKDLAVKKHYWEKRFARRRRFALKDIQKNKKNKLIPPKGLNQYKNYTKAKIMVAKYAEKVSNQKNDYLQKLTTELVKKYDLIVIEDLKIKNLLKNHTLANSIANQCWYSIRRMLSYKCKWYGKKLIIINPFKTSQICSYCNYDDGKHNLDIRSWVCPKCHAWHDRDINASKNILYSGLEQALVK